MSSAIPDLTSEDSTPVAGPSHLARAHRHGMRKALAILKNRFVQPATATENLKTGLVAYLKEWDAVYNEGVQVLGLTQTERTILMIRRDTVAQILKELGAH